MPPLQHVRTTPTDQCNVGKYEELLRVLLTERVKQLVGVLDAAMML